MTHHILQTAKVTLTVYSQNRSEGCCAETDGGEATRRKGDEGQRKSDSVWCLAREGQGEYGVPPSTCKGAIRIAGFPAEARGVVSLS